MEEFLCKRYFAININILVVIYRPCKLFVDKHDDCASLKAILYMSLLSNKHYIICKPGIKVSMRDLLKA